MRKFLLIPLLLTGCAVTLTDKAANIQVHNQMSTLLNNCKNLGPVTGSAEDIMFGPDRAAVTAKVKLRELAADKGGDTVVIVNRDDLTGNKVVLQGTAMRCY